MRSGDESKHQLVTNEMTLSVITLSEKEKGRVEAMKMDACLSQCIGFEEGGEI